MAVEWFDSLDRYGNSGSNCDIALLARAGYVANQTSSSTEGPTFYLTSGPFGGPALSPGRNNNDWVRWWYPTAIGPAFYFAAWIYLANVSNGFYVFRFISDDGGPHLTLYCNSTTGTISIRRNTTTLETTVLALATERWYHLEFYGLINDTTGAYTLKLNNTEWAADTGVDTRDGSFNLNVQSTDAWGDEGDAYLFAMPMFWSTAGDAPTASIGPHKIWSVRPDGDSATADFTPLGAGANYVEVDEAEADDDTSYNESSTTTHKDRLTCAAMSESPSTIYGVQAVACAKLTDAGSFGIKPGIYANGATESKPASAISLGIEWEYVTHLTTVNPNDSLAWEEADVNAAEVQYEVV